MDEIKIIRTDSELECPALDEGLRKLGDQLVLLPDGIEEEDLAREVSDADLLLMCYTPVKAHIIAEAHKLKGIVKYGVGIDAIDIEAAKAKHIPVVNVPEYAEESVAESAFGLLVALAKKLVPMHEATQSAGWLWPTPEWLGIDIAEKTVGLVGVGRIGRRFARMASAGFRAKVLGYDPHVSKAEMREVHVEKHDDLLEMLAQCDFVSVHCVLNSETTKLIGEREFRRMKTTAFLINVSRGAIVDEQALVHAISKQWIAGAGLDVYAREPLIRSGHPLSCLFDLPNVIMLPHLAFYTAEAMERLTGDTLKRCTEILNGEPVIVKSRDPRLRGQGPRVRLVN